MSLKALLLFGCLLAFRPVSASELRLNPLPSFPELEIQTKEFSSPGWADVLVFYDLAQRLQIQRHEQKFAFVLEAALFGYRAAYAGGLTLNLVPPPYDPRIEMERAYALEREADVVVYYDGSKRLYLQRPEQKEPFTSEAALLAHLSERQEGKHLIVVTLGKGHTYSDPQQTLSGFVQACKKAGFERVIVLQAISGWGNPFLHDE
jgi:hypothetical protein